MKTIVTTDVVFRFLLVMFFPNQMSELFGTFTKVLLKKRQSYSFGTENQTDLKLFFVFSTPVFLSCF